MSVGVKEAYSLGREAGYSAAVDMEEKGSGETWEEAAYESEDNARQYAGHYSEDLRTDAEWDAYERGVVKGITKGIKARLAGKASSGWSRWGFAGFR